MKSHSHFFAANAHPLIDRRTEAFHAYLKSVSPIPGDACIGVVPMELYLDQPRLFLFRFVTGLCRAGSQGSRSKRIAAAAAASAMGVAQHDAAGPVGSLIGVLATIALTSLIQNTPRPDPSQPRHDDHEEL